MGCLLDDWTVEVVDIVDTDGTLKAEGCSLSIWFDSDPPTFHLLLLSAFFSKKGAVALKMVLVLNWTVKSSLK